MSKQIYPGRNVWVLLATGLLGLGGVAESAQPETVVIGFEELALSGAGVSEYGGPGGGVYWNGSDRSGGFTVGGAHFENLYTDWGGGFYSWTGWSYSTTVDVATAGSGNQYSAYAGWAAEGSVYAVTYAPALVNLPEGWRTRLQIRVTNTTYEGVEMRDE